MMKPRPTKIHKSHKQTAIPKQRFSKTTINQFTVNPHRHSKCAEDLNSLVKTIRVSIEKSQLIGQNQYKKAIKHMIKVDSLEKKQKERKKHQLQQLTQQHTFKPKINGSSKTNYLYESMTHSLQKIHHKNLSKQRDPKQNIYDRLIKWGKNHDDRVRDNYLRGNVEKDSVKKSFESIGSISRQKWMGSKQKGQNLDNTRSSIQKMDQRFLNSLRSSHQTKRQPVRQYVNGEQSFYQRQAKAVAMRNGQTYYYSTNVHSTA